MEFEVTELQKKFSEAESDEVLFGGAAGGGKSYGQVIDAIKFAMEFPGSKQLIMRRTLVELERTLIPTALALYPNDIYSYSKSAHMGSFDNGSTIEFGYCGCENDVHRYQSAEYDVIRFDELTHFTESMYIYLFSRLRGANGYPKQLKSTTNPGGVGHEWVKRRFVDIGPPNAEHRIKDGTRLFIPAAVDDNVFLMRDDPGYKNRLGRLKAADRLALLEGEWNLREGRFFDEWRSAVHVVKPFEIPGHWARYLSMDYGLDMLAAYWTAVSDDGNAFVYRELYEPNLIVSQAAERIKAFMTESVAERFAPPDLWNRRNDTGRSAADIFFENGIALAKAPDARLAGWLEMKERLRVRTNEFGEASARLRFFDCCVNAIRCIPEIQCSRADPRDCARQPHELTHACDAIRYLCAATAETRFEVVTCDRQLDELINYKM